MMEPDQLPIWGMEKVKSSTHTVFLHEGAKAASHVAWMVAGETKDARDARASCPWSEQLGGAVHLGWVGGAPNPHRTDWASLRSSGVQLLIIVPDNDEIGQRAISRIAQATGMRALCVRFDSRWPSAFDLANKWPNAEQQPKWWKGKEYIGPRLQDMLSPATWATRRKQADGRGRPTYELRDEFIGDWLISLTPTLLIHSHYTMLRLDPATFNLKMKPFAHRNVDVFSLLAEVPSLQYDGMTYKPFRLGEEKSNRILLSDRRKLEINVYVPPFIRPVAGDVKPFLDFMEYLIPIESDRHEVLKWCASLIACPEIHLPYALLLISEQQGVGKSTLSDYILRPLVGEWNVSMPSENQIIEGAFNEWQVEKRLVIVGEIYSGERNNRGYNRLKDPITASNVHVNRKNVREYELPNFVQFVLCSNSTKALAIAEGDRRLLVPKVTENLRDKAYWKFLYGWLESGGLSAIAQWAIDFVAKHDAVSPADRAPDTSTKRAIQNENVPPGQDFARQLAHTAMGMMGNSPPVKVVLTMPDVREWVARRRGILTSDRTMDSASNLKKAMMKVGMMIPYPDLNGETRLDVKSHRTVVLANFELPPGTNWADIKEHHVTADKLLPLPL
jgi:hypothetical protein